LKLYCIWTWDTLWCFFCCCYFVLFFWFFSPLMTQWQNYFWDTISRIEAEGITPKLLRLKIYCIWTWRFFFQSSHCLSNGCLAYYWLVHYLSLFISLKLFCLFCYFYLFICFCLFL
jgi:hypothetical protein